jgi:NADPH-dependent 2,4-dienoyl-CoA reductase/sulfur reductase-like enzyme
MDGVLTLRSLRDADQLRVAISDAAKIAVVGAGFVGAEVAATVRALGLDVTMIDPLSYPMARVLGGALAERFIELHHTRGVKLLMNTKVHSIGKTGQGIERSV